MRSVFHIFKVCKEILLIKYFKAGLPIFYCKMGEMPVIFWKCFGSLARARCAGWPPVPHAGTHSPFPRCGRNTRTEATWEPPKGLRSARGHSTVPPGLVTTRGRAGRWRNQLPALQTAPSESSLSRSCATVGARNERGIDPCKYGIAVF